MKNSTRQVGVIIEQLKADNLYEKTIIFFFSDHGGPFPRYKRSIYETGIRVPMVAKWIDDNSEKTDQLVSFVDFAPTILDAANIKSAFPFEGVSFLKKTSDVMFMLLQTVLMDILISVEVFGKAILNSFIMMTLKPLRLNQ